MSAPGRIAEGESERKEPPVSVFSVWESRFRGDVAAEGLEVTAAIWRDMPSFAGYLRHVLIEDLDDPGHLLVVSEWRSREAADRVRDEYSGDENARRAEQLVAEPRRRFVGRRID